MNPIYIYIRALILNFGGSCMIRWASVLLLFLFIGCTESIKVEDDDQGGIRFGDDSVSSSQSSDESVLSSGVVSSDLSSSESNVLSSNNSSDSDAESNNDSSENGDGGSSVGQGDVSSGGESSSSEEAIPFIPVTVTVGGFTVEEYEIGKVKLTFTLEGVSENEIDFMQIRYKTKTPNESAFGSAQYGAETVTNSGTIYTALLDSPGKGIFFGLETIAFMVYTQTKDGRGLRFPETAMDGDVSGWEQYVVSEQNDNDSDLPWEVVDQPERVRITNKCDYPLWVQFGDNGQGVLESLNEQNKKLDVGDIFDIKVPDSGLSSTRFWPKMGCDESGNNCEVGQSTANDDGSEPIHGITAPIDSKFEATFEAVTETQNQTWYNASHVDGYTIPYVILPKGPDVKYDIDCVVVNGSQLDATQCPAHEDLKFDTYTDVDLRAFSGDEVIGCYSPCKYLSHTEQLDEWEGATVHYCCPTHLDAGGNLVAGITSEGCNDKEHQYSIWKTDYLKHLKEAAPTIYTFAYDDAESLFTCPNTTKFEVVFCPESDPWQPNKLKSINPNL
ncbi:MAG: hypothetical protein OCD76_05130 [Reichenbachiella sp.]